MNKKTIGLGVFSIFLGIAILLLSTSIKDFAAVGVGAKFFPRIAAVGFLLLGVILMYQGRRILVLGSSIPNENESTTQSWRAPLLSMVLLAIYVVLIPLLGFIFSSFLYVFLQILILNRGRKYHLLRYFIISAASSIVIYILFVRVFSVMIPAGLLG